MAAQKRDILWEVGCEGHVDAWVSAENWELATVEAAKCGACREAMKTEEQLLRRARERAYRAGRLV